jgi:hypothetical protein
MKIVKRLIFTKPIISCDCNTYQFISLYSPSEVLLDEKCRYVEDGFFWTWHDNKNWWAYELTYTDDDINEYCGVNDIIQSYGFESFTTQDDYIEWIAELDRERELTA